MTNEEDHIFYPTSPQEWRDWLIQNEHQEDSVWLLYYKKGSEQPSISWSAAVDEALCFGWIDSKKKSIDSEKYIQFFSKRRPKSTWSKVNKDKVKMLITNGLMTETGMKTIRTAKENGSWTMLDKVEQLIIPSDLEMAFKKIEGSIEFFLKQSKSAKKGMLYWVISAKRTETREKRISEIVSCAERGVKPKQF